jgi:peptide/nickel transport system permease protein
MMLDQNENSEQLALIKKKYGFDKPIATQYLYYINDLSPLSLHSKNESDYTYLSEGKYNAAPYSVSQFNLVIKTPYLRESFQKSGKKVSEIIGNTLPSTAILAFFAIVIAIVFGILGIISALHKDTWIDRLIALVSTLGMSIPSFLLFYLLGYLGLSYISTLI